MNTTGHSIDELVENFELLGDWESRFAYLIDLGKELTPLDPVDRCDENRVNGCQAQVWLKIEPADDARINIVADSDAFIVKGLIVVLLAIYSGKTSEEVLAIDGQAQLDRLQLASHLSPTRKNGLYAMVQRVRELAELERVA